MLKDIPLLPLRDVVVYPHMVIPLFVGREKSIAALEAAMASDKQIMLRHLSPDCQKLLSRSGQIIIDSEDDPDYGVVVDYSVKIGAMGGGH